MMRDTHKAHGGRTTGREGRNPDVSRRPSRLAARVRVVCLLLCVALALQPSLLAPGRAAPVRVRPAGASQASLMGLAARPIFAVITSVASILRPSAPSPAGVGIPAARLEAYEPEPAAAVFFLPAPSAMSVVSVSDSQVTLSWAPVSGASSYRVERSPDILTPYSTVGSTAGISFPDAGVTRGYTYLYRVRAVDATGALSPPSPAAMATAITFTDPELVGANDPQGRPATAVKAVHVNDLRLAVAGVRRAAALPAVAWAEEVRSGETLIRASHVEELRTKLGEARSALGLTTPAYTDAALQAGANGTAIKKVHFEELRSRSASGSGVTGSGLAAYDFASARLDASNRTGGGGIDLVSRNFGWSLPLVSLPGRAGLDLGLSLTYNSLVWTRSGNSVLFDGDGGWPAPGFRLGFAVVQGKFHDSQAQKDAYMLVTPSGARVSLRQVGTTAVYEAGDSSYLQLTEEADGGLTLRTSGGARMSYRPLGGVYKCVEVKDRNGNFITVTYNAFDNIGAVTDTLGRTINFGYYADGYLKEITQTWHREVESGSTTQTVTETHQWARFYYDDKVVQTNFTGLNVFGPANGQSIHALSKVTLADDSSFTFNYTTWGQVNQVAAYAADNRLLNYVSLDLPVDATAAQVDCPRPTQRRDWAAYWNGDADGAGASSEEAVTDYGPYDFASGVAKAEAPDGTLHKETYETSGWRKGLVTRADEFSADDHVHPKKWTVLDWTQDNVLLPYQQNPRVRETNVYDSMEDGTDNPRNRRRTEVVYTSFGLPQDVKEYDSTATAVLRRTHTEYVPDSVSAEGVYTLRRIIGLPQKQEVYGLEDGQEKLFSKVTLEYDLPTNGGTQYLVDAGTVAQHDGAYGASFATRGNACLARRWDAAYPNDASKSVLSEWIYDTLGSLLFTSDALGRRTTISYAGPNGAGQLAYPTKVTDPAGFYSTVEYNYDTGYVTRAVNQKGAATKTFYDSAGRRLKVKSESGGAYMRWEYGASGLYLKAFTTVDTGLPETFVMSVTDGAGRLRGSLSEMPGGAGGYSARRFGYDNIGQQVKRYNPIEVTVNASDPSDVNGWQPAGDDATANGGVGWVYSAAEYDWKGRVTREVNADGVTDRLTEYSGCGCAGGEVVTTRGELVPVPGTASTGRRTQKVYHDALGRAVQSQVLDWSGNIYSTATKKYNALDQVVRERQYAGAAPSPEPDSEGSNYLTMTRTYDGHGRLKTSHSPSQADANNQPLSTAYEYNADDTLLSVSDARGAKATYGYNSRRLPVSITYSAPTGSNLSVPPSVAYAYDEASRRTSTTTANGAGGSVTYAYDSFSRLISEARQFPGLPGTYTLAYEYTLAGQLKKVTDQSSPSSPVSFSYDYDAVGRMTAVKGNGFVSGSQTTFVSSLQYRAWGTLKHADYGNTTAATYGYNSRGLVSTYTLSGVKDPDTGQVRPEGGSFQYYADGRVMSASDNQSDAQTSGIHDRAYSYDYLGRVEQAFSGTDARNFVNGVNSNVADGPFRQSFGYDAWGRVTSRTARYWNKDDSSTESYDVITGRHSQPWEYDADGRLISRNEEPPSLLPFVPARYTYDAAGRRVQTTQTTSRVMFINSQPVTVKTAVTSADTYDGDGVGIRSAITKQINSQQPETDTSYYLRSSLLGGRVITAYNSQGARRASYVWAGGEVLAQQVDVDSWQPRLRWEQVNPVTGDGREIGASGTLAAATHLDAFGVDVGETNPFASGEASDPTIGVGPSEPAIRRIIAQIIDGYYNMRCRVDGIVTSCVVAHNELAAGGAVMCPNGDCGPRSVVYQGQRTLAVFHAYADGYQGYLPAGTSYTGNGVIAPTLTWMNRYLDEYDPNRSYTFEYTDPNTGKTTTEIGYGSVVSTAQGYFTQVPIPEADTWVTLRRLTPEELAPRQKLIEGMITVRCVQFVNSLVGMTTGRRYDAKNQLLADLTRIASFRGSDRVSGESGIFFRSDLHRFGVGGMQGGSLAAGTAGIFIDGTYSYFRVSSPVNISSDASTIFNELIHAVAAVGDVDGVRAVAEMGIIPVDWSGKPIPYPVAEAGNGAPYSNYFHTAIKNACGSNK
jgi:YD repeat-containing protein